MEHAKTDLQTHGEPQRLRDIERIEDGAWGFGALMGVIVACFVVLGVVIYFFGDDSATQTADNAPQPGTERMMKALPVPADPSTVGRGESR